MRIATHQDKPLLVHLLSQAFISNGSVNYVVGDSRGKRSRIHALMAYSVEICLRNGEIYIDEDSNGCALILYPHRRRTTIRSIVLDVQLAFNAVGLRGIRRVLRREAQIKKTRPGGNIAYLWFIGVDPDYQHKGVGSALLREVISMAFRDGLPVYLETSVPENLSWYQRFGFSIYGSIDFGHTLYFLKLSPAMAEG